jgi:hypothetical protein
MILKISQVNELKQAISGLEGVKRVVGDSWILEPFKFSGKTRWNLAKNLSILSSAVERYEKVKNDIILQVTGGVGIIEENDHAKMAEFVKLLSPILEAEEDFPGILKIKESDLNLDQNQIPLAVLKSLSLIIEQ